MIVRLGLGKRTMLLQELKNKNLITPPEFVPTNTVYLTTMGSVAYGVSTNSSDFDVYGVCVPPLEVMFPSCYGYVSGFDSASTFEVFQEHHVNYNDCEYDLNIYSLVKYVFLLMGNNPNMIDSLFTPDDCVLVKTRISDLLRKNKELFLSNQLYVKFKGYAKSQYMQLKAKLSHNNEKRNESIQTVGYDTKFAYHLIRLVSECEQMLLEGTLDLRRNTSILKDIRAGKVSMQEFDALYETHVKRLDYAHTKSVLPEVPDAVAIKTLLLSCIEDFYGYLPFNNAFRRK